MLETPKKDNANNQKNDKNKDIQKDNNLNINKTTVDVKVADEEIKKPEDITNNNANYYISHLQPSNQIDNEEKYLNLMDVSPFNNNNIFDSNMLINLNTSRQSATANPGTPVH